MIYRALLLPVLWVLLSIAAAGTNVNVTGDLRVVGKTRLQDSVRMDNLIGVGTRMVTADAFGRISTQSIPAGGSLANPTATIGLTVQNGVATSGMRSDGAPALDQSIGPTWTGRHRFNERVSLFDTLFFESTTNNRGFIWYNADTEMDHLRLVTSNSAHVDVQGTGTVFDFADAENRSYRDLRVQGEMQAQRVGANVNPDYPFHYAEDNTVLIMDGNGMQTWTTDNINSPTWTMSRNNGTAGSVTMLIDEDSTFFFYQGTVKTRVTRKVVQSIADVAGDIDIDANQSDYFSLTLDAPRTLANPTNGAPGRYFTLRIRQDATGGRTLAYGTSYRFPGGTVPVLTTTANATDYLAFIYNEIDETWDYVGNAFDFEAP